MHSAMTYELAKAQAATAAARPPRRPAAGAGCRACPGGGRAGGVPLGHGVRHVMVCECSPAQHRVQRLLAVGVAVGDAAAVPGLGDGRAVCDAVPHRVGVRGRAAGPAGDPVLDQPGVAGAADVLPRASRAARLSSVLLAVLARLLECPGHRGRAAAAGALDLGRGRLRPRAPVVPVRAAGVLAGTAAVVPLPDRPARDPAGRPRPGTRWPCWPRRPCR